MPYQFGGVMFPRFRRAALQWVQIVNPRFQAGPESAAIWAEAEPALLRKTSLQTIHASVALCSQPRRISRLNASRQAEDRLGNTDMRKTLFLCCVLALSDRTVDRPRRHTLARFCSWLRGRPPPPSESEPPATTRSQVPAFAVAGCPAPALLQSALAATSDPARWPDQNLLRQPPNSSRNTRQGLGKRRSKPNHRFVEDFPGTCRTVPNTSNRSAPNSSA